MTAAASSDTAATRPGWSLTLAVCAALALGSLLLLALAGVAEEGVRTWVRATARASLALFLLTFIARPLRQFVRSDATRWLLASRRYVGVAAAFAQLLHGISLVWLFSRFTRYEPDLVGTLGGGLGFAAYFAMALTSSDRARAAIGSRSWSSLHRAGSWWIWFVFLQTNAGNIAFAFEKLGVAHGLLYVGIVLALLAALALRVAAWVRSRSRT